MKSISKIKLNGVVLAIILLGAGTRFIPHPPNFTAIGAIALFGGAYFTRKWLAVVLPLITLLISDLFLQLFVPGMGFHKTMPFVYGSFVLISVMGFYLRSNKKAFPIAGLSLISSVLFFIITNFGSWVCYYPKTFTGISACYFAAIPFFQYNMLGDLFYNAVFFLSAYFIFQKSLVVAKIND